MSKIDKVVFVFGSNLKGIHGAGAAKFARDHYGAILGRGTGRQGGSYAIPTKQTPYTTLPLSTIKKFVDEFIKYASERSDHTFLLTRIGCGRAAYTDKDIAPMFEGAPDNVILVNDNQDDICKASEWYLNYEK